MTRDKRMGTTKISKGIYSYKGYRISNCGYHHPDHCIWWEAVNENTGCADYHATTKNEIIRMIDKATEKRKPLTGRAEFRISRNDMFWNCCIIDFDDDAYEAFHIRWSGYNDANWWDNVSKRASVVTCEGDKGTERKFKLDYKTLDVVEVV